MPRAGIALGSNIEPRLANIQAAMARLRALAVPATPVLQAPIYQTFPVDCPAGSPDFFNTVVEIDFAGTSHDLLVRLGMLESALGRSANPIRNAPRLIDADLLYFGDEVLTDGPLILPHPRLTRRRFVLQPLADIRPELVLPGHLCPVATLLAKLVSDEPDPLGIHLQW